jgi:fumarate hydratase class II
LARTAHVKGKPVIAEGRQCRRRQEDAAVQGDTRIERDSMGEVRVPAAALYGAQTQRAIDNFAFSGTPMPARFIHALGLVKAVAAEVNLALGLLDAARAHAIAAAAREVAAGRHDAQFPVDVFQTGSGTSSNMNANEVVANLAARATGLEIHPNDHVNLGQSSNDVVPTAIHVSACLAAHEDLLPALEGARATLLSRAREYADVVKTGRTHLMDAMPVRVGQELNAWASQLGDAATRIGESLRRLYRLAIGGTAVGTGVNAGPGFGSGVAQALAAETGLPFVSSDDHFRDLASQESAVEMAGQLNTLAVALMKLANDLRWMNSGPLAGLGEVRLPALQPGSSIMPGKVNPVIPEAVAMICAQVMGNYQAVVIAGQSGNFQLNVMLPLIAANLLHSMALLANAVCALDRLVLRGFEIDKARLADVVDRNPVLVTALNNRIGYEHGAEIAKRAYAEGRAVLDVAREMTDLDDDELRRLLDPRKLTG